MVIRAVPINRITTVIHEIEDLVLRPTNNETTSNNQQGFYGVSPGQLEFIILAIVYLISVIIFRIIVLLLVYSFWHHSNYFTITKYQDKKGNKKLNENSYYDPTQSSESHFTKNHKSDIRLQPTEKYTEVTWVFHDKGIWQICQKLNVIFRNYHNPNFTVRYYLRWLTPARMCTLHQNQ